MKALEVRIGIWLAAAAAVIVPAVLLWPERVALPPYDQPAAARMAPAEAPPLKAALSRSLFGPMFDAPGEAAEIEGAPQLVGIAGRLPDDAVALVRGYDGRTNALRVGDSAEGWRLSALAIDAAFFTRGDERVRVGLPPPE